ncbi:hypothetical protein Marpi_2089 [Marinitoga piezophila KA3]|uniref:Uncharacterized protein n=1 Tax=Marinitoga piezophila (strain DSM 14283 / JCM 11233 / KA3) TaxID=443254 RepID=H2J7H1_MARPK|nr:MULTISPECIES: hypothetical protein [Marinitoga]AEX86464.1 hypothetical protein Marpi_2089 [Marinitoga piezophila KA3]APT76849.1 hypothetical protein LN42_11020 [Marinitoga sp. 1137]
MKRRGLIVLLMMILTISLFADNLKMIKRIELEIENVQKPPKIVTAFTKNEVVLVPWVASGKYFEIRIYSLKDNTEQIIKKESPALYELGDLRSVTAITIFNFDDKFWIICGNEKNGDMEINEYIKKDNEYIFNKKLNLKIKSWAVMIDKELKDRLIISLGVNESERKIMVVDKNLEWHKDLITLNDFSGYLETAEYKDKLYIFESTGEKSVSSFFGSNSKYIKLKHTFDAKTYKLLKKDEKAFSDMKYYVYIYQDGKYAYFGNYGGKINIKRYNLENGKVEDINMEEIYPLLKEGKIEYSYFAYKNKKVLIEINEEDIMKLVMGEIINNKFKVIWKKELEKNGVFFPRTTKSIFLLIPDLPTEIEEVLYKGKNYKINFETGEITKITDKPIIFFKMKDKYYGVLNETEKKDGKNYSVFEIYELKIE